MKWGGGRSKWKNIPSNAILEPGSNDRTVSDLPAICGMPIFVFSIHSSYVKRKGRFHKHGCALSQEELDALCSHESFHLCCLLSLCSSIAPPLVRAVQMHVLAWKDLGGSVLCTPS
ncbi:hypothetical protein XELAEV_18027853mg [Xenopus laevis]|uniref:Uncharacterized protein n=1 Tax=Xenopus laevis TaxID=8355 RepID=A0A974CW33_XENLA|nr:hypothetical protein XELAEV_18027853mg [Xenopus laevis]